MSQWLHYYMVSGVTNSQFPHFGGDDCYNHISFTYHLYLVLSLTILSIIILYLYHNQTINPQILPHRNQYIKPNILQLAIYYLGLVNLGYTCWSKIIRREGVFILNPCHVSLALLLVLLKGDNSKYWMKWVYAAYTGWLFGAFAALLLPHLEGLNIVEIVAFFTEHTLIWPIGPLLLYRRYGTLRPTWKNHLTTYTTILLFHLLILIPVNRILKVNINFQSCPSPAQPLKHFGEHYLPLEYLNLFVISFVLRWFTHLYCRLLMGWTDRRRIQGEEENGEGKKGK